MDISDDDLPPQALPTNISDIDEDQEMANIPNEETTINETTDQSTTNTITEMTEIEEEIPKTTETQNATEMESNTNTIENTSEMEVDEKTTIEEIEEEEIIEEDEQESGGVIKPPNTEEIKENTNELQTKSLSNQPSIHQKTHQQKKIKLIGQQISLSSDTSIPVHFKLHLMHTWTVDDVQLWLNERFHGNWAKQYLHLFKYRNIDGKILLTLTDDQLRRDFSIHSPIHLLRISRDILDGKRPMKQLMQMYSPAYVDGGTLCSKLYRMTTVAIVELSSRVSILQSFSNVFKEQNVNGQQLLEMNEMEFSKIMNDSMVKILMDILQKLKCDDNQSMEYQEMEKGIHSIWKEIYDNNVVNQCNPEFALLPQHLRDFSKPYFPQNAQNLERNNVGNQRNGLQNQVQSKSQARAYFQERTGVNDDILPFSKDVRQWTTEDCIEWLTHIPSKINLHNRYARHFEMCRMTGMELLFMTPVTFADVCCITTKTHLKAMTKALDQLRDYIILKTFAQTSHVQEFQLQYGGGSHRNRSYPQYSSPAMVNGMNQQHFQAVKTVVQSPVVKIDTGVVKNGNKSLSASPEVGKSNGGVDVETNVNVDPQACKVCGETGGVMRCSQCKNAYYCCRDHQVQDWSTHSIICKQLSG